MNINQETIAAVVASIAGAAVIGGGNMVLDNSRNLALHDKQLIQVQQDNTTLREVVGDLEKVVRNLDKSVAVLTERMEK